MFCITLKDCFLEAKFLFCLNAHKLDDSFIFIWKRFYALLLFLCHILLFGFSDLNCRFICRGYGFSINSKISVMSSGDQPILIWRISVKNFTDVNILQILILKLYTHLAQNSFEWIAFCWVEYILFIF